MAWTKLKTAAVVAVGLLIAGGTTAIVVTDSQFSEPTYHWKSLSKWLEPTYRVERKYSKDGVSMNVTSVKDDSIDDAVRQMGTTAIPTLLRMVRDKSTNAMEMQNRAAYGFNALGPMAEEAISELSLLVTNRDFVQGAAKSLAGISPRALIPLLNAITNQDERVRSEVAGALGFVGFNSRRGMNPPLGEDASAALDALILCTSDKQDWVRAQAISSLGFIAQDSERIVPLLIEKLHDPFSWCRISAAHALGGFKNKAQSAIPALTEATNDSDEMVRKAAKDALNEIVASPP